MTTTERCALCGFPLDERAVGVSEGKLCNDSLGCRRRALKIIATYARALIAAKSAPRS